MDKNEKVEKLRALEIDFLSILDDLTALNKRIKEFSKHCEAKLAERGFNCAKQHLETVEECVCGLFTDVVLSLHKPSN